MKAVIAAERFKSQDYYSILQEVLFYVGSFTPRVCNAAGGSRAGDCITASHREYCCTHPLQVPQYTIAVINTPAHKPMTGWL